jgi:hypothetical protein
MLSRVMSPALVGERALAAITRQVGRLIGAGVEPPAEGAGC